MFVLLCENWGSDDELLMGANYLLNPQEISILKSYQPIYPEKINIRFANKLLY